MNASIRPGRGWNGFLVALVAAVLASCGGSDSGGPAASASRATVSPLAASRTTDVAVREVSTLPKRRARNWKGVTALVLAPDGLSIGVALADGTVTMLDTASLQPRLRVAAAGGAQAAGLVYSADGQRLAGAGRSSVVDVWETAGGALVRRLQGHEHAIRTLAASPDGAWLATGGEETRVMLWNAATGKLGRILRGATDFINAVAFSPDGSRVAAAGADGRVLVWNTATGELVHTLLGHFDEVETIAFAPGGRMLASSGDDARILIWDLAQGRQVRALSGHTAAVRTLVFGAGGRLLSAGEDAEIRVWDAGGGFALLKTLRRTAAGINVLAGHPRDANVVVAGDADGQVVVWDLANSTARQ